MTLKELLKIVEKNNIAEDVIFLSDSGWECSATEMNGVWYNAEDNIIVFTQRASRYDKEYFKNKNWKNLTELED